MSEEEMKTRLAEWAGFRLRKHLNSDYEYVYCLPDGRPYSFKGYPDFPHSLDACLAYLIPKLRLEFGEDAMVKLMEDWVREVILHYEIYIRKEALLLCQKIEEFLVSREI